MTKNLQMRGDATTPNNGARLNVNVASQIA